MAGLADPIPAINISRRAALNQPNVARDEAKTILYPDCGRAQVQTTRFSAGLLTLQIHDPDCQEPPDQTKGLTGGFISLDLSKN